MVLSRDEVLYVARLARLSLKEDEVDLFTRQLNDILIYMDQLKEVDTKGIPPMAHALAAVNVFREDEITPGLPRDEALANAPEREEGIFVVPRII